ncbi:MAG: zinc-ribbon domain-containing protein [Parasporobacterium sp.]|nr:zinc-ribbon domain-containing protein [Parasporobacterium sp.]
MAFCGNCGSPLAEGQKFCGKCGTPAGGTAPAPQAAPQAAAVGPAAPVAAFQAVKVRYRCDKCGHAFNGTDNDVTCPQCSAPLNKGGYIQLYRMGNMSGMAVGMSIYLNNTGYGMLANKESLRISVPYGTYTVHVAHTATRKCNDPVINITPQAPYAYYKAHFVKAGFAIALDPADPSEMPTR